MNQRQQHIFSILKYLNFPNDIIKSILPYDYFLQGNIDLTLFDLIPYGYGYLDYVIKILPDGRIVTNSCGEKLKIWNLVNGICDLTLIGHNARITTIKILSDLKRGPCLRRSLVLVLGYMIIH